MGKHEAKSKTLNKSLLVVLLLLIVTAGILFSDDLFSINKNQENGIANSTAKTEDKIEENTAVTENNIANENTVFPATTTTTTDNGIFAKYYEEAENLLKNMTLEEKVGQMFLARYPEEGVLDEIKTQNPGGYILFSRDFDNKTKESMIEELNNCQTNSKIKLALGVDEEGGTVVRVSNHTAFRSTKFLSPQSLWQQGQLPLILQDSKEKSQLLKA